MTVTKIQCRSSRVHTWIFSCLVSGAYAASIPLPVIAGWPYPMEQSMLFRDHLSRNVHHLLIVLINFKNIYIYIVKGS